MKLSNTFLLLAFVASMLLAATSAMAAPVLPGTGTLIEHVGDDFENPKWSFVHNHPKSSEEINGDMGGRQGRSANGRWYEGPKRGQPDQLQILPTPPGGLAKSKYSLLMRTLKSGVPGQYSYQTEQDDLVVDCHKRLGTTIKPSETPSFVVRVYLPPPEHWENRSGPHFGLRAGCSSQLVEKAKEDSLWGGTETINDPYWPGIWIHFRSETDKKNDKDSAFMKVRGDRRGRDFHVLEIKEFGWWTLGMSITSDGMVHYYASPGVGRLTEENHLTSQFPYSYQAQSFRTFFFNVCNRDDGKSWSTPFVIDDPQLYLANSGRVVGVLKKAEDRKKQIAKAKKDRVEKIAKQKELAKKRAQERTAARKKALAERTKKASQQTVTKSNSGSKQTRKANSQTKRRKVVRRSTAQRKGYSSPRRRQNR